MTSVSGHLLALDFIVAYRNWYIDCASAWLIHVRISFCGYIRTYYTCSHACYCSRRQYCVYLRVFLLPRNNCAPVSLFTADTLRYCPDNYIPIKVCTTCYYYSLSGWMALWCRGGVCVCVSAYVGEGDQGLPAPHLVDGWRQGGREHCRRDCPSLHWRSALSVL